MWSSLIFANFALWKEVYADPVDSVPKYVSFWSKNCFLQLKRSFSPYINHFISGDSAVTSYASPQTLNRYSYVGNNPLRYSDPTGHTRVEDAGSSKGSLSCSKYTQYCNNGKKKSKEELDAMHPIHKYLQKKTVDGILSKNPDFNPFTTGFENPGDYRGSNAETNDAEFLRLYESLGIDIDSYANQGLPNPISLDQVPKELQIRLPMSANDPETQFFLAQVQDVIGNDLTKHNMLNYEPNYVYSLMEKSS